MFEELEYLEAYDVLVLVWFALSILSMTHTASFEDEVRKEEIEAMFNLLSPSFLRAA